MRVILLGCEYSGTTTLGFRIQEWVHEVIGGHVNLVHDHFKIPYTFGHDPEYSTTPVEATPDELEAYMKLSPRQMEALQRHNIAYHVAAIPGMDDKVVIGLHWEDTIYGDIYFDYSRKRGYVQAMDRKLLNAVPDIVLCHVKASPEVIRQRMLDNPHPYGVLKESDIEMVQARFEEEISYSLLRHQITLDTSTATIEETMAEFVQKIEPHLTDTDRMRIVLQNAKKT